MQLGKFDYKGFGEALERAMAVRGTSKGDLWNATGVTPSMIDKALRGESVDIASRAMLAVWAGIGVETYTAKPPPPERFTAKDMFDAINDLALGYATHALDMEDRKEKLFKQLELLEGKLRELRVGF